MKVELLDRENAVIIDNFCFHPEDLRMGNPYNTTLDIYVRSGCGSFAGFGDCVCDFRCFEKFVCELQKLYDFKKETVTFTDIEYGSTLTFEMGKTGNVFIKGTVYAEHKTHGLTFGFDTDQTFLLPFIKGLSKLVQTEAERIGAIEIQPKPTHWWQRVKKK